MGFDLLEDYRSNPKAILRKTRARLKKTPVVETSGDSQAKRSLASEFESMADKTLHEFSAPTTANIRTGPAVNIGENGFELKLALITMVQASQLCEKSHEYVSAHLQYFLKIYNTFTLKGVSRDATLLCFFSIFTIGERKTVVLCQQRCHTRFSKEQNQANHMCAQEVHTYARMKKYQKQCYYITYT
jgi:hypothetical protein